MLELRLKLLGCHRFLLRLATQALHPSVYQFGFSVYSLDYFSTHVNSKKLCRVYYRRSGDCYVTAHSKDWVSDNRFYTNVPRPRAGSPLLVFFNLYGPILVSPMIKISRKGRFILVSIAAIRLPLIAPLTYRHASFWILDRLVTLAIKPGNQYQIYSPYIGSI